jgi:hypothetical protein
MNGLILAGANSSRSVPRQNRVYDLRPDPADGEIFDRSRNGNNAILSTGWAVTLDGITGHMQVDFATQQNVTVLTARVRSSTDTTFYAGTENASGTDTIVANDTWQDVSVTISDAVADELFVGSDDGSTNFFAGDICDVRVASVGTWYLNDHPAGSLDGLPAFDSSGNGNDGVHVGGTSIVGEGAPVPQTALQDWNRYYFMDGVNDEFVTTVSGSDATDHSIQYSFMHADSSEGDWILSNRNPAVPTNYIRFFYTPSGNVALSITSTGGTFGGDIILSASLVFGQTYDIDLQWDVSAKTITVTVDGGTPDVSTYTGTVPNAGVWRFGSDRGLIRFFKGVIFDATVNGTSYPFYGSPIDSGDATINGSPSNVYLPEASDNPGFDVLGNAIANPRGYLLNPRGVAGDYAEILYDPSLDVTTEMSGALVGNLYPATASTVYIYHRYYTTPNKRVWLIGYFGAKPTGVIRFYLSGDGTSAYIGEVALPDADIVLSWTFNAGTFKVYINGTETTVTTIGANPVPASLSTTDLPIRLFQNFDGGNPSDKQIGKTLMYNKALSDSEHVKIYRALRRYL